jgi:nicotinate-nucleotide pyrophosphorylase (carboxylating)
LIEPLFALIDPAIKVSLQCSDSAPLSSGTVICQLAGPIRGILAGERTALNLLQRLSGIATITARYAAQLNGTSAKLLDTRKTTPLLRLLEKKAVKAGGGYNHRFGLYDMILIKDTHVKAAGGPAAALRAVRAAHNGTFPCTVEVEVQNEKEFIEAISEKPNRIMLDNMPCDAMTRCVKHLRDSNLSIDLEASGNVTDQTIRAFAETGVDFISSGALTHSAGSLDIHLIIA